MVAKTQHFRGYARGYFIAWAVKFDLFGVHKVFIYRGLVLVWYKINRFFLVVGCCLFVIGVLYSIVLYKGVFLLIVVIGIVLVCFIVFWGVKIYVYTLFGGFAAFLKQRHIIC